MKRTRTTDAEREVGKVDIWVDISTNSPSLPTQQRLHEKFRKILKDAFNIELDPRSLAGDYWIIFKYHPTNPRIQVVIQIYEKTFPNAQSIQDGHNLMKKLLHDVEIGESFLLTTQVWDTDDHFLFRIADSE